MAFNYADAPIAAILLVFMTDLIYIAVVLAFFMAGGLYARGCGKL